MEPTSSRSRWILIAIVLGVIGLPLGGGILVWWQTRDLSQYQASIIDQVRRVTGRELQIRTPLRLGWSLRPSVVVEGVTLSSPRWGSRPDMLRVKKATIHLDLATLLLGNLKIGRLVLEGADLLVEQNANGESNLDMAPPPGGSGPHASEHRSLRLRGGPTLPWVGALEIYNSSVTVGGMEGRGPITISFERAMIASPNATTAFQGEIAGRVDGGGPFAVTGTFGSFDGWLKGLPGKIEGKGTLGAGTLAIDGSVTSKGVALNLKADGPDLNALSGFTRVTLPSVGPFSVQAKLANLRTGYKIEVPSLKVGEGEFTGEISFRTDRFGRKVATANFESARLDIVELRRSFPQQAPAPPGSGMTPATPALTDGSLPPARRAAAPATSDNRLLPSDPLPVDLLQKWNATITLKIGEVLNGNLKITSASVTLGLSGGRLILRPSGTIGAGSATIDIVYDVSAKTPSGSLNATLNRVAVEDLFLLTGTPAVVKEAVADLDLRMRGTGRTIRDLVASATGSIDLTMGGGRLLREHTHFVTGDWRRLTGAKEADDIAWGCLAARGDIAAGTAHFRRLVLDLPKSIVVGGGYLHSRSETFEFLLAPEPRDLALLAASVPLRVKGSTARIGSEIDPAAAKGVHLYPGPKPAPSLVGSAVSAAKPAAAGAGTLCTNFVQRLDGLRPNLRSQLPTPPVAAPERGRRQR